VGSSLRGRGSPYPPGTGVGLSVSSFLCSSSRWGRKKREASCGPALRGKTDEEEEQRSKEKGTLGKRPSRSRGLQTRKKSMAGTFGVLAGFALGDLPVSRAQVFCFSRPFATLLLWLPGESVNPVRRVSATVSAPEGELELSGPQGHPVSRGGPFCPPDSCGPGGFLPAASVTPRRRGVCHGMQPRWGGSEALLACSWVGVAPRPALDGVCTQFPVSCGKPSLPLALALSLFSLSLSLSGCVSEPVL